MSVPATAEVGQDGPYVVLEFNFSGLGAKSKLTLHIEPSRARKIANGLREFAHPVAEAERKAQLQGDSRGT